jgi:7,8-dihydropterin-6-yl-methyl-4-(beta-D-ribofuranosyl)aminobenzene 5'-phosphate synthase
MKLTVLVDNNTLIDRYFYGEPGVSYYIEADGKKVLFDVSYSDIFIQNARMMSIDLLDLEDVVLSHGHLDHTWGLDPLVRMYTEVGLEGLPAKRPKLVAHPGALLPKWNDDMPLSGSLIGVETLSAFFELKLSKVPFHLSENLVFLGEIERTNNFEAQEPHGKILDNGIEKDDYLLDDSALAYKTDRGLVIITGCSHSGICNIVEQARQVCGEQRVLGIIGGFHLMEPPQEQLQGTLDYMQALNPGELHACHCTDLDSKIALAKVANLKEVGVGLTLEYL